MIIQTRKLRRRDGTYGPAHDPYSFTERTVDVHTPHSHDVITLHCGLGVWLIWNGVRITDDEDMAVALFEFRTGMTVAQFDRAYDRVHPYVDDPMGPLSRYV